MLNKVRGESLSRSAVAIVAISLLLVSGVAGLHRSAPFAPDTAHTIDASMDMAIVVNADHTQVDHVDLSSWPSMLGKVDVPWIPRALLGLGILTMAAIAAVMFADRTPPPGRGPPRGLAAALRGQDLLTQFCLARR